MAPLGSPYSLSGISDFNTYYPDNPWVGITTKERLYYDPVLRDVYRFNNVFGQFTTFQKNMGAVNAKTMNITSLYDVHPNFNRLGLRDMSIPSSHVDSRAQEITFDRYGGKVSYHKYDELINYWQYNGGNISAIRRIVQDKLGQHMVDVQDMLSRNALLSVPFSLFTSNDSVNKFAGLTAVDNMSTSLLNEIHLGMKYRNVPYTRTGNGSVGTIVCITSPGVIFDLQSQTDPKDWLTPMAYADPTRLLNYEIGTYRNVRFVETPKCTLFNAGTVQIQATVSVAINAGDGAPDPNATLVDGTYKVGQPGATHYITLTNTTDMTQFAVNDIVSIHTQRTSDFGVTDGVDFRDGTLTNRRIVAIDAGNYRLSFEQPIMIDMTTALSSNVYAYVTKGLHVHSSIFVGGSDGIVQGVNQPPRFYSMDPVDDFKSIFRFSWDSYQGYVNYNPAVLEVVFSSGSYRGVGPMLQG